MLQARVGSLVYGAAEPKFGAVESLFDLREIRIPHRLSIESGVLAQDCRKILQDFFKFRRENV
jgi:tRNA(adenine34) deaminase